MFRFVLALRAGHAGDLIDFLARYEPGFRPAYAQEIAAEIFAFVTAHPDWRVVNDVSCSRIVCDAEKIAKFVAKGWDPNDEDFPIYRKVGSRYREDGSECLR